jgi:dolichyl-phosphate beta-glucosyltransferase
MLKRLESVSVVIPAYNEDKRIAPTLHRVAGWLSSEGAKFEIVVVDDGSRDDTAQVVSAAASDDPRIRLVSNGSNRGKGYSVRHGMLEATGRWRLFSDADMSTPIEELAKLAARTGDAEVVIGSRGLRESQILRRQPIYRESMGRIFNLLVQAAALPGIHDSQCGFKLFRGDVAEAVFRRVTIDGFGFDVEALFIARRLGYRLAEVPVVWVDDPATKVRPVRDASRMAMDLLRVRLRHAGLGAGGEAS